MICTEYRICGCLVVFACLLLPVGILSSCDEVENTGEYKLTGYIKDLIPEYCIDIAYSVTAGSDGDRYFVVTPQLRLEENFVYWGLGIKEVEYYIDDVLFTVLKTPSYELICPISELGQGHHVVWAKIIIGGLECDDAVFEKSCEFNVTSGGVVTASSAF